ESSFNLVRLVKPRKKVRDSFRFLDPDSFESSYHLGYQLIAVHVETTWWVWCDRDASKRDVAPLIAQSFGSTRMSPAAQKTPDRVFSRLASCPDPRHHHAAHIRVERNMLLWDLWGSSERHAAQEPAITRSRNSDADLPVPIPDDNCPF